MPDITISIVTYNCEKTIGKTLDSLLSHLPEGLSCQVFVIDNGSLDRTLAEVEPYCEKITLIHSPNGNIGFGAAHNLILDRIDSDMHIIMNPDITFADSTSIGTLFGYLKSHPDTGLVVPRIVDPEGNLQYLCRRNPTVLDLALRFIPGGHFRKRMDYHAMKDQDYGKSFDVPFASGCFLAIRTALFKELKGFDEGFFLYAEDADLSRRVNQTARTVYVPEAVVVHEWQRSSYKNLAMTRIHLRSLWHYFRKWGFQLK